MAPPSLSQILDTASVQWPLATGRVGYATRVQDWTRVAYPMRSVALVTRRNPSPKSYPNARPFLIDLMFVILVSDLQRIIGRFNVLTFFRRDISYYIKCNGKFVGA